MNPQNEMEEKLFPNSSKPDYIQVKSGQHGLTLSLDLGLKHYEAGQRLEQIKQLDYNNNTVTLVEVDGPTSLPWQSFTEHFLCILLEKNVRHLAVPEFKVETIRGKLHCYVMDKVMTSLTTVCVLDMDVPVRHLVTMTPLTSRILPLSGVAIDTELKAIMDTLWEFQQKKLVPAPLRRVICNLERVARKNTRNDKKNKSRYKSSSPIDVSDYDDNCSDITEPASPASIADDNQQEKSGKIPHDVTDDVTVGYDVTGTATPIVGISKYDKKCQDVPQTKKCYVCKMRFLVVVVTDEVRKQYPRLCESCAALNLEMRTKRVNLKGHYAVVTGGRVKIGYDIVLKLLRDGCHVITTTRFPHDAAKRFAIEDDFTSWSQRLKIYPLELKDYKGIYRFIEHLKQTLPHLDILINNAAQTLHRPNTFYEHLMGHEQLALESLPANQQEVLVKGAGLTYKDLDQTLVGVLCGNKDRAVVDVDLPFKTAIKPHLNQPKQAKTVLTIEPFTTYLSDCDSPDTNKQEPSTSKLKQQMRPSSSPLKRKQPDTLDLARPTTKMPKVEVSVKSKINITKVTKVDIQDDLDEVTKSDLAMEDTTEDVAVVTKQDFPVGCLDEFGQQLDLRATNSWRSVLEDVQIPELVEVLMVNTIAPYILNKELKGLLTSSPHTKRYIVNVSAMEGQFNRSSKTKYHPHTNMAKAAVNMMTRTGALGYREADIFMTAVDTGWVTDERPFQQASHEADSKGFILPLDCLDGAARVLHPVYHGVENPDQEPYYAVFLKNYSPYPW